MGMGKEEGWQRGRERGGMESREVKGKRCKGRGKVLGKESCT